MRISSRMCQGLLGALLLLLAPACRQARNCGTLVASEQVIAVSPNPDSI